MDASCDADRGLSPSRNEKNSAQTKNNTERKIKLRQHFESRQTTIRWLSNSPTGKIDAYACLQKRTKIPLGLKVHSDGTHGNKLPKQAGQAARRGKSYPGQDTLPRSHGRLSSRRYTIQYNKIAPAKQGGSKEISKTTR